MKPSKSVWTDVKERDEHACVACGRQHLLTFQHRKATGMGGTSIPPTVVEGIVLCLICNSEVERSLQTLALAAGWKVPRWVKDAAEVPVFYPYSFAWVRLKANGDVLRIHADEAAEMMRDVYGGVWAEWVAEVDGLRPVRRAG